MADGPRVLVDTDTARDDAVALLLAAAHARIEAVTVVAGNVAFDRQVENAKYALDLAGIDADVHEGARAPLAKEYRTAEDVHGVGGLGGDLRPETGIASATGHGAVRIVDAARANPGQLRLVCLGPLTNVALALWLEPDLPALLDGVWVMGGARNTLGNVTPAAEFNFWVDPDAAALVVEAVDPILIEWGLSRAVARLTPDDHARIRGAVEASPAAEFYGTVFDLDDGGDVIADALAMAVAVEPSLVEAAGDRYVAVDEREGLTRGYSLVDDDGVLDRDPTARVVDAVDAARFRELVVGAITDPP